MKYNVHNLQSMDWCPNCRHGWAAQLKRDNSRDCQQFCVHNNIVSRFSFNSAFEPRFDTCIDCRQFEPQVSALRDENLDLRRQLASALETIKWVNEEIGMDVQFYEVERLVRSKCRSSLGRTTKEACEGVIRQKEDIIKRALNDRLGREYVGSDLAHLERVIHVGREEEYHFQGEPLVTFYPPEFSEEIKSVSCLLTVGVKYRVHEGRG